MSGQPLSVDQSDRIVPINLRQSGRTPTELLISTRVRKSPLLASVPRRGRLAGQGSRSGVRRAGRERP